LGRELLGGVGGNTRVAGKGGEGYAGCVRVEGERGRDDTVSSSLRMSNSSFLIRVVANEHSGKLCEAFVAVGQDKLAVQHILSYWGSMVDAGAETFWEGWDPKQPRSSPYGDLHSNS
jgi:hypothetical protein